MSWVARTTSNIDGLRGVVGVRGPTPVGYAPFRTFICDNKCMDSREFIRRARAYARRNGKAFAYDPALGRGSHGRLYVGSRFTTVRRGELGKGLLAAMLRQLDIDRREF